MENHSVTHLFERLELFVKTHDETSALLALGELRDRLLVPPATPDPSDETTDLRATVADLEGIIESRGVWIDGLLEEIEHLKEENGRLQKHAVDATEILATDPAGGHVMAVAT